MNAVFPVNDEVVQDILPGTSGCGLSWPFSELNPLGLICSLNKSETFKDCQLCKEWGHVSLGSCPAPEPSFKGQHLPQCFQGSRCSSIAGFSCLLHVWTFPDRLSTPKLRRLINRVFVFFLGFQVSFSGGHKPCKIPEWRFPKPAQPLAL